MAARAGALRLIPMGEQEKDIEILVLRHQLTVLQRQLAPARVRFSSEDRADCRTVSQRALRWVGVWALAPDHALGSRGGRNTRYVMLLHLPHGRTAEHVRDALVKAFAGLPHELARSLTWDQGTEMSRHDEFTRATGIPVYFCDPASPWQRGSNENTNGLLRQYFPKGTGLSLYSAEDLATVAA
jgi:transposase InsO family protein